MKIGLFQGRDWKKRGMAAAVLLLVLASAAVLVWNRREPPPPPPLPLLPDEASLAESDVGLLATDPATGSGPFPYLVPMVQAIDYRLRDIELAGRNRGYRFRHVFQAGCGSGFLRENTVGNDFDYMITVHLGELATDLADPVQAADDLLTRIESYLGLFYRVVHDQAGPDLAMHQWPDMRGDRLRNRSRVQQHLAESLTAFRDGRPRCFLLDGEQGRRVPCCVAAGELSLPTDLLASLLSNRVQYGPRMYAGIRGVGVLFRFYCDLVYPGPDGPPVTRRNVPVNPLHSSGRVLDMRNGFIGMAPAGAESAAFLRAEIASDPARWVRYRVDVGADLLSQVTRYLDEQKPMKALKRLHQSYDFLEPMLDPDAFAGLRPFLRRHLQDPDVLLCEDIRELSSQAAVAVDEPWLRRLYAGSGDLPRTLRQILLNLARFEKRGPPALAQEAAALKAALEPIVAEGSRSYGSRERMQIEAALEAIEQQAARWSAALLEPAAGEIAQWRDRIRQELAACGVRPFRAYGLPTNEVVGILSADMAGVVTMDALNQLAAQTNVPPFQYCSLEPDQIPPDRQGETDYFPCYLWLRPAPGPAEEERFRQALDRIEADMVRSGLRVQPP
ncbi:MAG TPA: hypothetical protein P5567_14235 [Kiritimatiellia bacterium]|nr:hypothetical protein [Kiritimatiellia bacterium]HRZ13601.1 hypothetical protein [Kiritimatiellia bacterium]HSA19303.1 hypothetical protein [Kiritimatiellia bacterium]